MSDGPTITPADARAHARSQGGRVMLSMPTIPASDIGDLPGGIAAADLLWAERLGAGAYACHRLPRGARIRLVDLDGEACAGVLLHNAGMPSERLSVADTVKVQWQAYLCEGSLLLSDRGRVLATVIADTSGHHDALCGCTTPASAIPFDAGDLPRPDLSGRDLFALAVAKYGLERRDVAPNVNFFRGVHVSEHGALSFSPAMIPGARVELRCEMDLLVSIINAPHPLDPRVPAPASAVRVLAWSSAPTTINDTWRHAHPEAERAFENVDDYLKGFGE